MIAPVSVDTDTTTLNQTQPSPHYFIFLHRFYHVSHSEFDGVIRQCHAGLRHVADHDPDHAQKNRIGFSASDQVLGHKLARASVNTFLRSEVLANALHKPAIKYRRQYQAHSGSIRFQGNVWPLGKGYDPACGRTRSGEHWM